MNAPDRKQSEVPELSRRDLLDSGLALSGVAAPGAVNRTHRIVRERAKTIAARRSRLRSLWIPVTVSTFLFASVLFAIWSVLDQYELAADWMQDALPDSSQQFMVLLMWCLPLSLMVLTVVWLTRSGTRADGTRTDGFSRDGFSPDRFSRDRGR